MEKYAVYTYENQQVLSLHKSWSLAYRKIEKNPAALDITIVPDHIKRGDTLHVAGLTISRIIKG